MQQQLNQLLDEAQAAVAAADKPEAVEDLRVKYLGKKGLLTDQLKALGALPADERPRVGQWLNQVKQQLQQSISARKLALEQAVQAQQLSQGQLDVTLPGRGLGQGGLHPVTRTLQRLQTLFQQMGYTIAEGPEIEDDFHNFEALNIPENHPARAMHDTFYFDAHRLLRTHTSPVQSALYAGTQTTIAYHCPGACLPL